ncbi:MAG: Inner rane transport protein YeaN [Actinomycetota bacterium]|jgi:CP family cyanate transporter-like MFS transporter
MGTTTRSKAALRDSIVAVIGVILIAANTRSAVSGLSPIYDIVNQDVALGIDARAILGSLPPIGFVIGGLLTPRLTRRIGLEWNLVTLVALIAIGHTVRAFATDWAILALGSAIALIGSGMGNVSLPPTIKKYFPDHIGPMSATYITFVSLGSVVPPLIAVPLSESMSWQFTMMIWATFAAMALLPWFVEIRSGHNSGDPLGSVDGEKLAVTKSPTAWAIAVSLCVSSATGYGMFAWLPDIAKDAAGMSELEGGLMLSVFAFAGTPMSLAMPLIAARIKNIGWLAALGGALIVGGFTAMLVAPSAAPFLWVVIFGSGPLLFPMALVLINLRTESTSASLQLSSFAQFVAYSFAATVPPLMGLSRALTGSWDVALTGLALSGLGAAWAAVILARNNTIESELTSR